MNNLPQNNFYSEVESLITILELWIPVLEEMDNLGKNLEKLPRDLVFLRQQLKNLKTEVYPISLVTKLDTFKLKKKVENIVKELDRALPKLSKLDGKLKNLMALKERIEVLQDRQKILIKPDRSLDFCKFKSQYPNYTNHTKLHLIHRLQIFKRQYPENFWSGIIAIFIFLVICSKATAIPSLNSQNLKNTNQNIELVF